MTIKGKKTRFERRTLGGVTVLLVACLTAMGALSATSALANSAWLQVTTTPQPTNLSPGGTGKIFLAVTNLGDEAVNGTAKPLTIKDTLPPGLKVTAITGKAGASLQFSSNGSLSCTLVTLVCAWSGGMLEPYERIWVEMSVSVATGAAENEVNEVVVSGSGLATASNKHTLKISGAPVAFGVDNYELTPEEEGGGLDTQAGSHPFQLTTTIGFNETASAPFQPAPPKDLHFQLPPGLIGNPTPFPECTAAQFGGIQTGAGPGSTNKCADDTVVGVAQVLVDELGPLGLLNLSVPLFNLVPERGEPAKFGFEVSETAVVLDTSVRTGGDYGVTVSVNNIAEVSVLLESRVTFWGVPGDQRHDESRGWHCGGLFGHSQCKLLKDEHPQPLLTLPTSCTGPMQTSVDADSWGNEGVFGSFAPSVPLTGLGGCNRLGFEPSINVAPDGSAGSSPTGLTVGIHVPQDSSLNPVGLAGSAVRDTTVALPAGVALNPAAADGLQACTDVAEPGRPEGEIALNSSAPISCPDASKVGTVSIKTPLLPNALEGAAYLAAQNANPFGSLVAMYIVAEDPVSGTLVKLAGKVIPDPVTGQLVASFENTPQLPFEDLKLHFFGGDRAPLSTPATCGSYTTAASIAPWSGNEVANATSTFDITSGPGGSACADPLPFAPSLAAGMTSIQAAGFSPFTLTMSREDGQQDLQGVQLHMPAGLLGVVSSVKPCGEAQANAGTCGADSLIGHTVVSVGLGGDPYSVTGGQVFLTGPYQGAPYGLSIVNPAKAGPFDLGNVIVRARIEVDPHTAALTITTDGSGPYAIPHILDGIPLQIKHVNVTIDRPGFTFNPTNCDKTQISGNLSSAQGTTRSVGVPFQVTNCATLAFKPQFKVSTGGKTSRAKGASLDVKLSYPAGSFGEEANIKSVKVDLPKQLPSRLTTLQKACPAATFTQNPAACPAASRVGSAAATTPILAGTLSGPAYFVSYGGAKFPELVVVLSGQGVTVQLNGETFISKAGITSSTFRTVPDVPIGTFELKLPEGPFSALAANGNLCTGKLKMPTAFTAQNGMTIKQSTSMTVTGCTKHVSQVRKKKHHRKKK